MEAGSTASDVAIEKSRAFRYRLTEFICSIVWDRRILCFGKIMIFVLFCSTSYADAGFAERPESHIWTAYSSATHVSVVLKSRSSLDKSCAQIIWTCCNHFKPSETWKPSSLNVVTLSMTVPLTVAGGGHALEIKRIRISSVFLLSTTIIPVSVILHKACL